MPFAGNTVQRLLASRTSGGVWEGRLSSSALSTATAVIALSATPEDAGFVHRGRQWLAENQNSDGGWGDTVISISNISTTALCWAALPDCDAATRAEAWLRKAAGSTKPEALSKAIAARYGKDQTFSVPILTALAIGGRLGKPADAWRHVPQLPFELAAFPHQWFQILQLPVVSYALPALIAIGLARHQNRASRNLPARALRNRTTARVMKILRRIQPSCGGFLEATPLTSFVAMSLTAAGLGSGDVAKSCLGFLRSAIRNDGSWPIDTNLSTWLTTLSINALCQGGQNEVLQERDRSQLTEWLLAQQFVVEHPYTHAAPGAWSWTNLPGAVPDADDTAGALLALSKLGVKTNEVRNAAARGVEWLLNLQNRDGGMPTFCRGWGHLPFDRSGADLTAHALRAWHTWMPQINGSQSAQIKRAIAKALVYLKSTQQSDGSWVPLWFGNQHAPHDQNPTFGTSRVAVALHEVEGPSAALSAGLRWLASAQDPNGGWGGAPGIAPSIEETSLAVAALASSGDPQHQSAIQSGLAWLAERTRNGTQFPSSPIGFYFASLWYFEELYPLVFATAAVQATGEGDSGEGDRRICPQRKQ